MTRSYSLKFSFYGVFIRRAFEVYLSQQAGYNAAMFAFEIGETEDIIKSNTKEQ